VVKQREGYKVVIEQAALDREKAGLCPVCCLPKAEWKRRKDWRCCSTECSSRYYKEMVVCYGWPELRKKVFIRDNYTCVKCGYQPWEMIWGNGCVMHGKQRWEAEPEVIGFKGDASKLVADHIVPIALGGQEWDIKNIQTLCEKCNKEKTAGDIKKIAELRRVEKTLQNGQVSLQNISLNTSIPVPGPVRSANSE